jgi:hypothetical protein
MDSEDLNVRRWQLVVNDLASVILVTLSNGPYIP